MAYAYGYITYVHDIEIIYVYSGLFWQYGFFPLLSPVQRWVVLEKNVDQGKFEHWIGDLGFLVYFSSCVGCKWITVLSIDVSTCGLNALIHQIFIECFQGFYFK